MQMRVVTWNCNGAFRRKFSELSATGADVLIIQECENPATSKSAAYRDWCGEAYLWVGDSPSKGLGVFPQKGNPIVPISNPIGRARHFLPFSILDIPICAVWAHRDPTGPLDYIGQVWNLIQARPDWLPHPKCILAGDFNSSPIWDKKRAPCNHSAVVLALADMGLRSAYHDVWPDLPGAESRPTFFMQRNLMKPYHIDYAFVGKGWVVKDVTVGAAKTWLAHSDHVPVVFELSECVQD